jgi:multifunctional 2-oxoglutarate metabolism enzyme
MHPELDPTYYGLSIWDLDREFLTTSAGKTQKRAFGEILGTLRDAYCRTIGIEYGHILDPEEKRLDPHQVEGVNDDLEADDQTWILERLNAAEAFESFLHQVCGPEALRSRRWRVAHPTARRAMRGVRRQ